MHIFFVYVCASVCVHVYGVDEVLGRDGQGRRRKEGSVGSGIAKFWLHDENDGDDVAIGGDDDDNSAKRLNNSSSRGFCIHIILMF